MGFGLARLFIFCLNKVTLTPRSVPLILSFLMPLKKIVNSKSGATAKKVPAKKAAKPATTVKKTQKSNTPPIVLPSFGKKSSTRPTVASRTTTVRASVDVGWGNALYIRGEGAGLSWDKGILMDGVNGDCWEWKTVAPHKGLIFKFLINDSQWSMGDNLMAAYGETSISSPSF